ncbi:hypothetical protein [Streptosporangium sp. NPDC002721]|uniref:hypothetical protein n=1 Tax=Streptosporangium sp. NPDC002721 TaxID=3366188 RepID=UPI00368224DA
MILRILSVTAMLAAMLAAGPLSVANTAGPSQAGSSRVAASAEAAGAALPWQWGYAYVRGSSVVDGAHQAGSWAYGLKAEASPGGPGQVFVKFPQIGLASGGVAHVTAVSRSADWCQVQEWWQSGTDEIVAVQCYRYGGTPGFTPFSVVFGHSAQVPRAPGAFGYVHWNGSAVAGQFNSSAPGVVNSVLASSSPGTWQVTLPGLGSTGYAGNIQVTAVDPAVPARCKLSGWSPSAAQQRIVVRCHDATDAPVNTGWSLTYHRERAVVSAVPQYGFAYTFNNEPDRLGSYRPMPVAVSHNSRSGGVRIDHVGIGRANVLFGDVTGGYRDNVQVTAFGYGPEFCNLNTPWESYPTYPAYVNIRYVTCYNGTTQVDHPSMVTYLSASTPSS